MPNGAEIFVDRKKNADPNADGVNFAVENLPKGPAFIQTWFYSASGDMEGAVYFTYARPDVITKTDERVTK
jgi:hypothetical protein